MAKRKDHIINSEEYQRYLNGHMTSGERHYFEKYLLDNDFEQEAFEGLSQLTSKEMDEDFSTLKIKLADKAIMKYSMNYWKIAASLLLLGLFSFIVYFLINLGTIPETTQTKSIVPKVSEVQEKSNEKTFADTSILEEDRIVAYRQDLAKTKKSSPKSIRKSNVQESILEKPSIAQSIETEGAKEILKEMEVLESNDLPTLALADDVQIVDKLSRQENKKLSKKSLTPAATLSKASAARQSANRTISGVVVSVEDDEVIPGVSINVKETNIEVISDVDGKYVIDVPTGEDVVLVFSYVGFTTQEILSADHDEIIDVKIEPDITALSEIVVAGYGTSSKSKMQNYNFIPPSPVGGLGKFNDYVKENIRYPESGLKDKVKGIVKLKFTVEQNGDISNMEVLKSLGEEFDKEAIRLVNEGPKWKPATENNSNVAKEVKMKIRFRVPD